jgi:hypothetical protein
VVHGRRARCARGPDSTYDEEYGRGNVVVLTPLSSPNGTRRVEGRVCISGVMYLSKSYYGETVRLLYVLNMLVIVCCETTLKPHKQISYHSQKTSAILSEFGSGP